MKTRTSTQPNIRNLPALPSAVRYYDDFSDSYSELSNLSHTDRWTIGYDGHRRTLDFTKYHPDVRDVIKSWCANSLPTLAPATIEGYYYALRKLTPGQTLGAVESPPQRIRSVWKSLHASDVSYESLQALQNLLMFCCRYRVSSWAPEWEDLVSQLPLPRVDKYASVRTGDAFLPVTAQADIVSYIDEVAGLVRTNPLSVPDEVLERAAVFVCSFQFAFRPKQIAMLRLQNVRIWSDTGEAAVVHLTFRMIKQRDRTKVLPMVRRVKRDWAPIFVELSSRARDAGQTDADRIFRRTPDEVGLLIQDTAESVAQQSYSATAFRHTAAQRMVDAGASKKELADFMGHSDPETGQIYYQSSPSQAERVNRALGLSAVYRQVIKIAHARFISSEELASLKGEQQVAGVPHGIPISGIGGCSLGQPACPYNPIMSCYGCTRFMPVTDVGIHRRVLDDLRSVVKFFYAASRAERGSPAFQLERTIAQVQSVVKELEEPDELPS